MTDEAIFNFIDTLVYSEMVSFGTGCRLEVDGIACSVKGVKLSQPEYCTSANSQLS